MRRSENVRFDESSLPLARDRFMHCFFNAYEGCWSPPADPLGPSVFTALQEQLTLKLHSQEGPVGIFVIRGLSTLSALLSAQGQRRIHPRRAQRGNERRK